MSRTDQATPVTGHPTRVDALVSELLAVLAKGGVGEPRREASDIVATLLDRPRLWPAAHGDSPVSDHDAGRMRAAARRRATGAPFAYAVARASFRHLTLAVDERVLIPRVETEELVTAVLEAIAGREGGIAVDLGTGSGAIALSLAQEGAFERVIGTDLSTGALAVARENAERCAHELRTPVEFRAGSWLAPVAGLRVRAVVANPPYIAHDEAGELPRSVRDWEPALALFSADSGMRDIACIIREAPGVLESGGLLALEVDSRRASLAAELALADGRYRDVSVRLDLAGRERILMARRGEE